MDYEFKSAEFVGPLHKLLELIEGKELEITRLSLAEVTADFLSYMRKMEGAEPKVLADFIAIAAKLILIKSHAILPQMEIAPEEEKEIVDLEARLRIYREFKSAELKIKDLWFKRIAFGREFLRNVPVGFYLSQRILPDDLKKCMDKLSAEVELLFPKRDSSEIKMFNLEERIRELMERVDKLFKTSFNEIAKGKDRSEIVVMFLALLHLLKDNLIAVSQKDEFSDIEISSVKNNEQ